MVAQEKGDWRTAHLLAQEIKRNGLRNGFPPHGIFEDETTLVHTAMMLGESAEAKSHLGETISLYDKFVIPTAFDRWLIIASAFFLRQSDFSGAAKLIARVNVDREGPHSFLLNVEKQLFAELLVQCRAALSPEEFEAAWAHGQTMTNEEAIALVAEAIG